MTNDLHGLILRRFATVSQVEVARITGIDHTHLSKFVGADPITGRGLRIDQIGPVLAALGLVVIECDGDAVTMPAKRAEALAYLAAEALAATQKHVPLQFTAIEKALKLDDFKERFLRPAINTLGAVVHADLLAKAVALTPNIIGTAGTLPTTMKTWGLARARMGDCLAAEGDRAAIISHDINTEMVDASKALFHSSKEINRQYLKGNLGEAQGFDFYESSAVPSITNGNKVAGVTVSGAGQTGSALTVGGVAGADTFKKGQVFTIAGVYAVHPLTGTALPWLRQFVVTADTTSGGATVAVPVYPAIKAAAPGATVNALPANGAALTFVGAASTAYRQNLTYHRDAFTAAFVPLPVLASCEGYTFRGKGISVRVMTFGDGTNDLEKTRIDVLYGFAGVRPLHATRVTE